MLTPAANGCLEWTGHTVKSNGLESHRYGRVKVRGCDILAHRYAYTLTHGEIPRGLSVCHRCDNTKCCNVDHLFLGTHRENMSDMAAKGRAARIPNPKPTGEKSPTAKLLDAQIAEIRVRREFGETVTSLAAAYGVHHSYVSRLARGVRR